MIRMVGAAGFELATLCSQSRCSTRLNYAPHAIIDGAVTVTLMSAGFEGLRQALGSPAVT